MTSLNQGWSVLAIYDAGYKYCNNLTPSKLMIIWVRTHGFAASNCLITLHNLNWLWWGTELQCNFMVQHIVAPGVYLAVGKICSCQSLCNEIDQNKHKLQRDFPSWRTNWKYAFHALIPIAWLADEESLMCYIVMMGRQIAKMFSTCSLWGSLFLIVAVC